MYIVVVLSVISRCVIEITPGWKFQLIVLLAFLGVKYFEAIIYVKWLQIQKIKKQTNNKI